MPDGPSGLGGQGGPGGPMGGGIGPFSQGGLYGSQRRPYGHPLSPGQQAERYGAKGFMAILMGTFGLLGAGANLLMNKWAKDRGYKDFTSWVVKTNKTGVDPKDANSLIGVLDSALKPEDAAIVKENLKSYQRLLDSGHNEKNASMKAIDSSTKLSDQEKLEAKRAMVAAYTGDESYDPTMKGRTPAKDSWVQYYETRNFNFEDPDSSELRSGQDKFGGKLGLPEPGISNQRPIRPGDPPVRIAGGPGGASVLDMLPTAGGGGPPSNVAPNPFVGGGQPAAGAGVPAQYDSAGIPGYMLPFWNSLMNLMFGQGGGQGFQNMLTEDLNYQRKLWDDFLKDKEAAKSEITGFQEDLGQPKFGISIGGQKVGVIPKRNIQAMQALSGLTMQKYGMDKDATVGGMQFTPNADKMKYLQTLMDSLKNLPQYRQPQEDKDAGFWDWANLGLGGLNLWGKFAGKWD